MYFDRVVSPQTFAVDKLISLSESYRTHRYREYLEGLDELLVTLKSPHARLLKQPWFVWDQVGESPCWLFSRHQALHSPCHVPFRFVRHVQQA